MLDKPRRGNSELGVGDGEKEGTVGRKWEAGNKTAAGEKVEKERSEGEDKERTVQMQREKVKEKEKNPWAKRAEGVPGQSYEPEAWTPGSISKR